MDINSLYLLSKIFRAFCEQRSESDKKYFDKNGHNASAATSWTLREKRSVLARKNAKHDSICSTRQIRNVSAMFCNPN